MATKEMVEQARGKAVQSATEASDLISGSYNIESELKKKLDQAYDYNKDIVKPLDEATSTYLTAPQTAREKYQDIFNPFSREKLVSQYVQQEAMPMLSLANIYGSRRGTMQDIINSGTNAYNAKVSSAQNQAQIDRQSFQDLLSELQREEDIALEREKIAASNSGGGMDFRDLIALGNFFKLNQGETEALGKWESAKSSIDNIKKTLEEKPGTWATAAMPGIMGNIKRRFDPEAQSLIQDITYLKDVFARYQTGAAMTKEETALYNQFVNGDPLAILAQDPTSAKRSLEILSGLADKTIQTYQPRENAFQGVFGALTGMQGMEGGAGQSMTNSMPPLTSFERY